MTLLRLMMSSTVCAAARCSGPATAIPKSSAMVKLKSRPKPCLIASSPDYELMIAKVLCGSSLRQPSRHLAGPAMVPEVIRHGFETRWLRFRAAGAVEGFAGSLQGERRTREHRAATKQVRLEARLDRGAARQREALDRRGVVGGLEAIDDRPALQRDAPLIRADIRVRVDALGPHLEGEGDLIPGSPDPLEVRIAAIDDASDFDRLAVDRDAR